MQLRTFRRSQKGATSTVITRTIVWRCPWLLLISKAVRRDAARALDDYYSVRQPDYVNIFAITHNGLTPIVRQIRPAVEDYTWELPAGTRDAGETARAAATRELEEETGLRVIEMVNLGRSYIDTGRLSNCFYSFVAIAEPGRRKGRERGVASRLVSMSRLRQMIRRGELSLQTHVGLVLNAMTHPVSMRMLARHGFGDLPRRFLSLLGQGL